MQFWMVGEFLKDTDPEQSYKGTLVSYNLVLKIMLCAEQTLTFIFVPFLMEERTQKIQSLKNLDSNSQTKKYSRLKALQVIVLDFKTVFIDIYYTTSSASGQDDPNLML